MANLQSASSYEASRPPASKTLSMKTTDRFNGTQLLNFRSFILSFQSFQLILHNYQATFSEDRKKFLSSTSFLICRAENRLSLSFPTSLIKTQTTSSRTGPYSNINSLLYLEIQMESENLKQNWMISE
ncbi:hypothetical protein O181_058571 [Austropuccinia psidii MF-1]|uniref:Uncharacterized protein n=1 Tax=Austropuccinia psidii MF-1 TaxID=1389203 RepID=A0A9Q3EHC0_9BASI|nr:hypothetical protein [Austropuccinia psidii MF-1]